MKITKRQLRKIIREEKAILERSPTLMRTGMTSGGKGPMPGPTPKDRDTMVKEIEPQLAAAIESGKTQGIPQGWIDAANADSIHDVDPKFSLRRPEANGGPTDEEIMALSKALNPSMFSKFKRMIGMKEGTVKITRRQLQRIIKEEKARILAEQQLDPQVAAQSLESLRSAGALEKIQNVATEAQKQLDAVSDEYDVGLMDAGLNELAMDLRAVGDLLDKIRQEAYEQR